MDIAGGGVDDDVASPSAHNHRSRARLDRNRPTAGLSRHPPSHVADEDRTSGLKDADAKLGFGDGDPAAAAGLDHHLSGSAFDFNRSRTGPRLHLTNGPNLDPAAPASFQLSRTDDLAQMYGTGVGLGDKTASRPHVNRSAATGTEVGLSHRLSHPNGAGVGGDLEPAAGDIDLHHPAPTGGGDDLLRPLADADRAGVGGGADPPRRAVDGDTAAATCFGAYVAARPPDLDGSGVGAGDYSL